MKHKIFMEKMKLLYLENNTDNMFKQNIIENMKEIKKITNEFLELDNYKTNFFHDCNIEELMCSRERISKLLKEGDSNLKLLHSYIR